MYMQHAYAVIMFSDFKHIRPNFLSEIITLARESKGPLPYCSYKVLTFCPLIKQN